MTGRLPIRLTRAFCIAAAVIVSNIALPALANGIPVGTPMQTGIVLVKNSPFVIQKCQLLKDQNYRNSWSGTLVVGNRTKHQLAAARIVLVAYDAENTRLGGQQVVEERFTTPLVSGDVASSDLSVSLPDTPLLSRVSCRVDAAEFSANKRWKYGQAWSEKLVPLTVETPVDTGGSNTPIRNEVKAKPTSARPILSVTNAWNDVVQGVTFVHTALTVSANDLEATLSSSDVVLTVNLANGSRKVYAALSSGAPTYQKLNPLGSGTLTAYEVNPSEDLGRLGTISVPPHGQARIVATFAIQEQMANPDDNRAVTIK